MRTVNSRQLQHQTRRIREWLEAGETLEWKARGKTIGYLMPTGVASEEKPWPDLKARLKTLSAGKVAGAPTASELIYSEREQN